VYRGSKAAKVISAGHDKLAEFGKGQAIRRTEVERIFHFMMLENILTEVSLTNRMGFASSYLRVSKAYIVGSTMAKIL
jgi:bloom syndrome protein